MRRRSLLTSSGGGGHDFIEIGGIKWATMNIGAETETDYGLHFQWGDTAGYTTGQCGSNSTAYKKPFYYSDYKFNGGRTTIYPSGFTKYNSSDAKTVLEPSDDAATLYWGGDWRMPTTAEFIALSAAVTTEWVTNYQGSGVNGRLMTDKTDSSKKLFFPAAGTCNGGSHKGGGSYGYYWSSSLNAPSYVEYVYTMFFNSSNISWQASYGRYNGYSVRPVLDI